MDLFGKALLDYWHGETGYEIAIERDDGFVDAHSPALYFAPEPDGLEVAVLAGAHGPFLDIGCGAGRHLLGALARGEVAVGLDISEGAVEICRARGCKDVRQADVHDRGWQREGERFSAILMFGNNIGIGGTWAGAKALLARLRDVIEEDGRLLLTSIDVERTDDPVHLAYHAQNTAYDVPKGQIRMRFHHRGGIGPWINWLHLSPKELERLAAETGWELHRVVEASSPLYAAELRPA